MQIGKKILSIGLISGMLFLVSATPARAGYWGEATAAAFLQRQLNNAWEYVEGTLLGSLKVAAYRALSSKITQLITGQGGSGNSAQFITNWESFLYDEAKKVAKVAVNDFYVTSLRGMLDTGGYVPAYGSGGGGGWPQQLKEIADASIFKKPQYTLNEYCIDPSLMFQGEDMRCFNAYFSNPMNNPYGYSMAAQEVYLAETMRRQDIARTQAIAYKGYKGTVDKNGNTLTPGSTVAAMQEAMNSHLLGMPLAAKSSAEIATMTASTFVNSLLQQAVQQGMTRVETEVQNKVNEGINKVAQKLGPAAEFLPLQQIGSDVTRATLNTGYKWALGTSTTTPATGSVTAPQTLQYRYSSSPR